MRPAEGLIENIPTKITVIDYKFDRTIAQIATWICGPVNLQP